MATARKKKKPKIKFELSRGAIGGIGIVLFCLFLWMFLAGVWAGQSLLKPEALLEPDEEETPLLESTVHFEEQKKHKP